MATARAESTHVLDQLWGVLATPKAALKAVAEEKRVVWGLLIHAVVAAVGALQAGDDRLIAEEMGPVYPETPGFFTAFATSLLGVLILVALVHLIARLLGGRGSLGGVVAATGFAQFPTALSWPVELLAGAAGGAGPLAVVRFGILVWVLILSILAVREAHSLSTGRAIGSVALAAVIGGFGLLAFSMLVGLFALLAGGLL